MSKKQKQRDSLPKRLPTKRQLDKWERQRRWQMIITYASAAVIGAVLILVGVGFYRDEIEPRSQPVIAVGDKEFNLGYFTNVLALYTKTDPSQASSAISYVVQDIQRNEIITRGADAMGIKVGDEEVSNKIAEFKLDNTPEMRDLVRAQLLDQKLRTDYFGLQVPTSADQQNLELMFLESVEVYNNIRDKLAKGEEFAKLAVEFSYDPWTQPKDGKTGWQPKVLMDELARTDKVWGTASQLDKGSISEPVYDPLVKYVGYWVIQVTKIDEGGNRQIRGILLGSEQEALDIIAKLKSGEDFGKLARDFSQSTESKDRNGELSTDFINARPDLKEGIADLEVNQISEPIREDSAQTTGGYWLIKVIDKEKDRALDEDTRNQLIDKAFQKWLDEESKKTKVENLITPDQMLWALAHLPKQRAK
ncbi:MAG: peptidylprolyl isomerase [Chloroflexota bacterium]